MLTSREMAAGAHISLDRYLVTCYRPDREFVDGELRERNVGKYEHARVQALLAGWIGSHEEEWGVAGCIAVRVRVAQNRVRVPDIVVPRAWPQPDVLTDPPLLVIEILSPDDTYSDTQERAQDYRAMGVGTVWIIDPKTRTGRMCSGAKWVEAGRLEVKGTPLFVELGEIFGQLISA
jgi:Uma2 family endonuclease